jgi:thiol-disulfide isomerase/thioredoxin
MSHIHRQRGFALLLAFAALVSGCSTANRGGATPQGSSPPRTGMPLPLSQTLEAGQHGWTLLDGNRETLGEQTGRVLVLDFYATWCGPCRESVPQLVELQRRYGPQGLRIVGLNVGGPEDRFQIADFVREFGIQYDLGYPDEGMSDLFFADDTRIPQTFVFDRHGRLVRRFIGYDPSTAQELERAIREALAAT